MSAKTFEEFAISARAAGYEEVLERVWGPAIELDAHTHDFDAQALVIQGEMWLTCDGITQHLTMGNGFSLDRGVSHSERYGPEGATFWVARRRAPRQEAPVIGRRPA